MTRPTLARLSFAVALLSLALAACGGPELHQGYFSYGFETVAFRPCGSADSWWVTGEGEAAQSLIEQYTAIASSSYDEVYVELRGTVSGEGTYGHLGAYTREFNVTEVVTVQADPPADCS